MKIEFPKDFLWGSATASYQVEGAVAEDGRKDSIWDTFCAVEGNILDNHDGSIAADQYHRYRQDIGIMRKLGLQAYRFSLAWPRILPSGEGLVNESGIAYYRALMSELRNVGIKVVATLYHWDLPQVLEEKGGWRSRDTAFAFEQYAKVCYEHFDDLVDQWITVNEPWCIAYLGHMTGEHAPGRKSHDETIRVIHHINLAHGLAVRALRRMGSNTPIGPSWNLFVHRNATNREEDIEAAKKSLVYETRVFTDPVLHGHYPKELENDPLWTFSIQEGDLELIRQEIDFIGINYYQETVVEASVTAGRGYAQVPTWQSTTSQDWAINPDGLYRILRWIANEAPQIPLYITENGCAFDDKVSSDGRVHDADRIRYIIRHLEVCKKALDAGVPLKGFFYWSFIDNFEWAWGYGKRFGIIYCDYTTQTRIIKDSGYFLRDVIANYFEY